MAIALCTKQQLYSAHNIKWISWLERSAISMCIFALSYSECKNRFYR